MLIPKSFNTPSLDGTDGCPGIEERQDCSFHVENTMSDFIEESSGKLKR